MWIPPFRITVGHLVVHSSCVFDAPSTMLLYDLLVGGKELNHSNGLRLGRFHLFLNMFLDFFAHPVQNCFLFDSCGSLFLTQSAIFSLFGMKSLHGLFNLFDSSKGFHHFKYSGGAQADLHDR